MPGTTPVYGFPYPEPTDLVADYPALGQDLAEDIEAVLPTIGGLAPRIPTSIANSGGSASLTGNTVTFTGITSVSLNGVFAASFDNYRIVISATGSTNGSAGVATRLRVRSSGTDYTGALYYELGTYSAASGGPARYWNVTQTAATIGWHYDNGGYTATDIRAPFTTGANKFIVGTSFGGGGGDAYSGVPCGQILNTSSYDGFTIFPASGTLTGTVAVYGYRK